MKFKRILQEIDQLFKDDERDKLPKLVFAISNFEENEEEAQSRQLQKTENAQPAIGALSGGMFRLLQSRGLKVDFTFLNIVNKKNLLKRLKKRVILNRYDKFQMKFYNKVQNGFIKIFKKNKSNYLIINSNLDIKKNKEIVVKKLKRILNIR